MRGDRAHGKNRATSQALDQSPGDFWQYYLFFAELLKEVARQFATRMAR
jgi:hypothetical protein